MEGPYPTHSVKKTCLFSVLLMSAVLLALPLEALRACACGSSTYNVGTGNNFPKGPGGLVWTEYDYVGQSQNWSGLSPSAADKNPHKLIQTSWLQGGFQYFFNEKWGASVVIPSANRIMVMDESHDHGQDAIPPEAAAPVAPDADHHHHHGHESTPAAAPTSQSSTPPPPATGTQTKQWWGMGDIRLNGYYTGFSKDMTTGVNLGMKFATGNWTEPEVDRDNQIGTGSTDILCGFFHRHRITLDEKWSWFATAQLDAPVISQGGYTPGLQIDTSAGIYYTGLRLGGVKIRPLGQVLFTNRASDSGPAADPANTGYQQLSLSPGIEFDFKKVRLYADAELPVMNNMVGNQLIAPCTVKVIASLLF